MEAAYCQKKERKKERKQIDFKVKDLYWIIGHKSIMSLDSKVLLYKAILNLSGHMESNYGVAPASRALQ
jgi:hypothetical protein